VFNLGMGEITVILLLALIFLGPSKLPDLAAGLGKLIKEIRKATSDVKNEIALDDSFRKPFEDLRDAITLTPEELKRRDQWAKEREEAAKRAAEEAAKFAADTANGPQGPPDGLSDDVKISPEELAQRTAAAAPKLPEPHGPNETIVQPSPAHATLDDIPTPPPAAAAKPPAPPPEPSLFAGYTGAPPAGTVARNAPKPATAAAPRPADTANATQILREEDLIPTATSGGPPPPPHLPGLRPPTAPRPVVSSSSTSAPPPADKKSS
jgi:sec-independent protein translocase protein TatB